MYPRVYKFLLIIIIISIAVISQTNIALGTDSLGSWFENLKTAAGQRGAGYETSAEPESIISMIISIALSFIGVVFLVLMIYGGYLWMTAHGNEEQAAKAKKLIGAAIIGLVIVISAYAISWFVISKLGGAALEPTS